MTDITQELNKIQSAVYGEEVRSSIISALKKNNDDNNAQENVKEETRRLRKETEQLKNTTLADNNATKEAIKTRKQEMEASFLTKKSELEQIKTNAKIEFEGIKIATNQLKTDTYDKVEEYKRKVAEAQTTNTKLEQNTSTAKQTISKLEQVAENGKQVKSNLDNSKSLADSTKTALEEVIRQGDSKKTELENATRTANTAKEELGTKTASANQTLANIKGAESKVTELSGKVADVKRQTDTLGSTIEQKKREIETLNNSIKQVNTSIEAKANEVKENIKRQVTEDLANAKKEADEKIEALKGAKKNIEGVYKNVEATRLDLEQQNEKAEGFLQNLKNRQVDVNTFNSLLDRLDKLEKKIKGGVGGTDLEGELLQLINNNNLTAEKYEKNKIYITSNTKLLEAMYNNCKTLRGSDNPRYVTGKFIPLEISDGNYFSSSLGCVTFKGGLQPNWNDYKNKYGLIIKYKDYATQISSDNDSNDWIKYYVLK